MSWQRVRFEEVALPKKGAIVSGPFGSSIGSRFFVEEGVPVIRGNNLTFGQRRFNDDGFVFLAEEKAQEFRNCEAVEGDLIFTAAGTIGQVGIIPKNARFERYIISNKQLRVRCDKSKVNPLFLFLWFTTSEMRQHIINRNSGSTIPLINLGILRGLPLPLPPLEVQNSIADLVSAYDDLIENNRRRKALLEESARLLYREWFVRLRFPGYEHTAIVDGTPQGWDRGSIADFFKTSSGGTPSRANLDYYGGDINWVKTQELTDDFIFETMEQITEAAIAKSSAKLFPENTILVSIYGGTNIGRTGVLVRPSATNQACCALLPLDERTHFIFTALYFREQREKLIGLGQGAAQTNISQQVVRALPMMLPTRGLMTAFVEILSPVFEQIKSLQLQNQKLRAARDLLLPRLMSGELAV